MVMELVMIKNKRKNIKPQRSPKKSSQENISEEAYNEINSKAFFQNFQVLIHHYKREDEQHSKK